MSADLLSEVFSAHITGVVATVPAQRVTNADLALAHAEAVSGLTGVMERRHADLHQNADSLCAVAADRLLERVGWHPADVGALVYVTQTPASLMPSSAHLLHGRLGLSASCPAIQVNWSCSGYVHGLWLAMQLARAGGCVLLLVGDTVSRLTAPDDRATAPLFGDAGSATAVEGNTGENITSFLLGNDGTAARKLNALPCGKMSMDGAAVFGFALRTLPPLVTRLLAGDTMPDHVLFHQSAKFMLDHFANKLFHVREVPTDPLFMPTNIAEYGNCSSASIPLLLCDKLGMRAAGKRVALIGYGAGWAWGGALLWLHDLRCAEVVEAA